MAISSVNTASVGSASSINSFISSSKSNAVKAGTTFTSASACPTCNKSGAGQSNQLYAGFTSRASSDSFFCATCNKGVATQASSPFGGSNRVTPNSSGTYKAPAFCPTCGQASAPAANHWLGPAHTTVRTVTAPR